ncbi:MAG: hypothetical protein GWP91_09490 [Rhodobacterales bacterium]|nr:hypothetical protein [Rhodobacterales bacterium]
MTFSLDLLLYAVVAPILWLTDPTKPLSFGFWISTAVLAVFVTWRQLGTANPRVLLDRLLPDGLISHRSARADYLVIFVNHAMGILLFMQIVFTAPQVADWMNGQLQLLFGVENLGYTTGFWGSVVWTLVIVLAFDAAHFLGHYAMHAIPTLWAFHRVHHSAEVLLPTTLLREHPVNWWVRTVVMSFFGGLFLGVIGFVFAERPTEIAFLGFNAIVFFVLISGFHLRHTDVWLMYPGPLKYIFSSPALHQIHHSTDPRHHNTNIGRYFVFWDMIAGTFYLPEEREELTFGIVEPERIDFDYHSVWAIYIEPFYRAFELLGLRASPEVLEQKEPPS